MVARVYRDPNLTGAYGLYQTHFFATVFSVDPGWQIIDSYNDNAAPHRLKGDPITGGIGGLWGGISYLNTAANSWFVARQLNPEGGFAPMEVKIQAAGNANYADPSGIDYNHEGVLRASCVRFAPFGGWDQADVNPDFANPATKVSRDMRSRWWSGNLRTYMIVDDDYFVCLQYEASSYIELSTFASVPWYVGRYDPLTPGQHAAAHPCHMYWGFDADVDLPAYASGDNNRWFFNTREYDSNDQHLLVVCPDENGEVKQWTAMCPNFQGFLDGSCYPNEFDTGSTPTMDLIKVPIYGKTFFDRSELLGPSPDYRYIGYHKHVFMAHGLGIGQLVDSQQFFPCAENRLGIVTRWDGATTFVP